MARTSSPRTWAVRIAAIATALLTAKVVMTNLATIDAHAHRLGSEVGVVVARHNLALGTRLRADDLRTVLRHRSQVPSDSLTSLDAAADAIVKVPVLANAVLQSGHIVSARSPAAPATTSSAIPPGFRMIRVVDNGGLVPEPGAIVDVLSVAEPRENVIPPDTAEDSASDAPLRDASGERAAPLPSSYVIAHGATVLATSAPDTSRSRAATGGGNNSVRNAARSRATTDETGIVLLVRAQEAQAIASALAYGGVTIVLAPPEDACCATPSVP